MRIHSYGLALIAIGILVTSCRGAEDDHREVPGADPQPAEWSAVPAPGSEIEETFAAGLSTVHIRTWLKTLSARPHHAGSQGSAAVAEDIEKKFRNWGFKTEIETFYVLMPTPEALAVEVIAPHPYAAKLKEQRFPDDITEEATGALPPYSAYSADGEVTAPVVYVNYGMDEDYRILSEHGIDVRGKIVLARFGGCWRGNIPRFAATHGAIGAIMFSDPEDYGFVQGPVYPEGRFLPNGGYQRGSVIDLPRFVGDPLTPGRGAPTEPYTFSVHDAKPYISPIPVVPLSPEDVAPILAAMGGAIAPPDWQGALDAPYRLGNDTVQLHLLAKHVWNLVPLHNVIAKIEGSTFPDEWVIRGNNHDAWIYGSEDPLSGLVAMLEEARGISLLLESGWRPKRTMVYAAWDGEELGLMGATEWAETHRKELSEKAVLYLNSGPTTPGSFFAGGSHSLEAVVDRVSKVVEDPSRKVTVFERYADQVRQVGDKRKVRDLETGNRIRLDSLGASSDYAPFLQHLGIPALYIGFEGDAPNGIYHTAYDNFALYDRLGEDARRYIVSLSEAAGRIMLRFADTDLLPFDFSGTVFAFQTYISEIEDSLAPADGPNNLQTQPSENTGDPGFVVDTLERARHRLEQASNRYSAAVSPYRQSTKTLDRQALVRVNQRLFQAERSFLVQAGLPGRPWYRHYIYAPSLATGYSPMPLPGVREALEANDLSAARRQAEIVAGLISAFADEIDFASDSLLEN